MQNPQGGATTEKGKISEYSKTIFHFQSIAIYVKVVSIELSIQKQKKNLVAMYVLFFLNCHDKKIDYDFNRIGVTFSVERDLKCCELLF